MEKTMSISDVYMPVLLNFSKEDKLNIISQLTASLKDNYTEKKDDMNIFNCFSGDWENEKSTAEVVASYRDNSYSDPNKKIEW